MMLSYLIQMISLSAVLYSCCSGAIVQPQLELQMKMGKARDIGRGSWLMPLWQQEGHLLFSHIVGTMDNKNSQEANLGLGYRQQVAQGIWGMYGYYDRRHSPADHLFHQATLGIEYLSRTLEVRANGYVSSKRKKWLSNSFNRQDGYVSARHGLGCIHHRLFEQALNGVDVELGMPVTQTPLHLYGGYYYFARSALSTVHGPRIRIQLMMRNWLLISSEMQRDRVRGLGYFVGITLKAPLQDRGRLRGSLPHMSQSPVRDVDVMVGMGQRAVEFDLKAAEVITTYEDLNTKVRNNLSGQYVITQDIVASGHKHRPIGTKAQPFSGMIAGVNENQTAFKVRSIGDLDIEPSGRYVGLFGYVKQAWIGYLAVHAQLDLEADNKVIGGIAGHAKDNTALIHNVSALDFCCDGKKNKIGGIVGQASWQTDLAHNISCGVIYGQGQRNNLGGIAGQLKRSMLVDNTNQALVLGEGYSHALGGIVGKSNKEVVLIHNTNQADLSASGYHHTIGGLGGYLHAAELMENINRGLLSGSGVDHALGGIAGYTSLCALLGNINYGSISVQGEEHGVGGIVGHGDQGSWIISNVNYGSCLAPNNIKNHMGGIVGELEEARVEFNINRGVILSMYVADLQHRNIVGDIIGVKSGAAGVGENQWGFTQIEGMTAIGSPPSHVPYQVSTLTKYDSDHWSSWITGSGVDWLIEADGFLLAWPIRKAALAILQRLNELKVIKAQAYLSLKLISYLVAQMEPLYHDLHKAQINRIFQYAFAPLTASVALSSQPKSQWTKDDFLNYVVEGIVP